MAFTLDEIMKALQDTLKMVNHEADSAAIEELSPEAEISSILSDLGMDSMHMWEWIGAVEDTLGLANPGLPEEEINAANTLHELATLFAKHLAASGNFFDTSSN